ncbi:MFS transporter [Saccharopolyspora erythraea]|uniref:Integral membrane transport protein n=1 Tax=Saccharopolyspora erythraea (strain ATCC 11635 / DSM 40517 / JCM 4748 / NBRC 13426 / NCIMB 8594 / NRRL 2338) TaxID=405948 RepID=A4FBF4_SACEN|nr:MFS transporter [Saccharopolyspora erythraea D]CAM01379.1 putative integral membrane transport protein [Saccharopolyspora erythraea NRRL 2338]
MLDVIETSPEVVRQRRFHPAWWVAAVAFVALLGAAAFRSVPGVLMNPLHHEFGWPHSTISLAVSLNLLLYGLTAPFAAALMARFGIRVVTVCALLLVAAGSGLTVFMTASWQLVLCWGLLVGLGTGSMALAFVSTVVDRWFVARRGLVSGVLTAASATGQLVFLPLVAHLAGAYGWRSASLLVTAAALAIVPLVWLLLRDRPADVGVLAYGASEPLPEPRTGNAAAAALTALRDAARTPAFWLLAAAFAICGASTNGLVNTHFVPAAHDHGMPQTTAAGLLAVIGVFDVAGTVLSGWLTDRFNPRILLAVYYTLRGASLFVLPQLFAPTPGAQMVLFVVFYGLDWIATVPPTMALCREHFGERASVVFGWVFASHQIGAAAIASIAGVVRDQFGDYAAAWYGAGLLCLLATAFSLSVRKARPAPPSEPDRERAATGR